MAEGQLYLPTDKTASEAVFQGDNIILCVLPTLYYFLRRSSWLNK